MEIHILIAFLLITVNVSLFDIILCDTCVRDIQDFANATELLRDPSNVEQLADLDFTMDPTVLEAFLDTCRFEPVPRLTTPRLCKVACSVLPPCLAYAFVDDAVTVSGVTMSTGCELCVADTGGTGSSLLEHASNAIMVGLQAFREHILDINACASSPCNPNGACTNEGDGYICDCIDGFTGANCESVIPEDPATSTGITLSVSQTASATWGNAYWECLGAGMEMVMPKNEEEANNLRNEIGRGVQVFIGLKWDWNTHSFLWIDDSTPSWTPWIDGRPTSGSGYCAYMDIPTQGTFTFRQMNCQHAVHYKVVCQNEQD